MPTYFKKLKETIRDKETCFCLGLDIDVSKLPPGFSRSVKGMRHFCKEIINITHEFVAAYKFNFAFYEYFGSEGYRVLEECAQEAEGKALLIADAKRGDIGNTARFYADSIFRQMPFDACTVNPYMGEDAIIPFLQNEGKGVYILCLTSNPSASRIQNVGNQFPVFKVVMELAGELGREQCGVVVGATKNDLLRSLSLDYPGIPFLIPGIGKQGGDERLVTEVCRNEPIHLVNVSRAALYPEEGGFPENVYNTVKSYSKKFEIREQNEKG